MGARTQRSLRRTNRLCTVVGVLALVMTLLPTAALAEVAPAEPLVIDMPGWQGQPMTDGAFVVWAQERADGGTETDIFAARLADGVVFPVRVGYSSIELHGVSDGRVVWSEADVCTDCALVIMGFDLHTRSEFVVADEPVFGGHAAISGEWVVWDAWSDGGYDIWAWNAATTEPAMRLADQRTRVADIRVDGTRIVWEEHEVDGDDGNWGLYAIDINGPVTSPLLIYFGQNGPKIPGSWGFDLAGDLVVVMHYYSGLLTIVDPVAGMVEDIVGTGYDNYPTTDGRYVIWNEADNAGGGLHRSLRAYDLLTRTLFTIVDHPGQHTIFGPDLQNGVLVWSFGGEYDTAIYASQLRDLLPTAPRLDDGGGSYSPETGHALTGGFASFWERHGGLPVFGYPLTDEFQQFIDANAGTLPTQFTERQRFEWHPENAGTPYEVLLGRLGADLLAAQGRDWTDFPEADPTMPHYTPETGQAIDERFYPSWSSHGLDLGDEGVSFRESLALFGFPISPVLEETNADGDTVLTQYFERAVFEWHPENAGTEYEVLLRRVSVDLLQAYGWMHAPLP